MSIRFFLSSLVLAAVSTISLQASAANVNANAARQAASNFLKQHAAATPGTLRAPALSDIHLAYSETSSTDRSASAYHAFNISGGGFIIIAGDDRANQVLGYSDCGQLDFNNLPDNFKALLQSYKEEIEYLQAHPTLSMTPALRASSGNGVEPLIKCNWGQEMPYYLQCPVYNGEYCVVGCVATAMTQVMYYWQYPTTCSGVNAYYCYDIGQTLPALPETGFDYSKMLPSYCHWDWDQGKLIQDTYTDEQAAEVAKIARYCGQAVHMGYSPEGSGAYVSDQLSAMKKFGFSSDARSVSRSSWWSESYTTAEWEALIREELDKRYPILYSATDPAAGGHAFICDGYNNEGLFHFNFGWYGTCDGWYASTALNMTHRDGDYLRFNSDHEMLLGVVPPTYCLITTDGISAPSELLVLGEDMNIEASNVNIMATSSSFNLMFTLIDADGKRKATSNATKVIVDEFEQGSTVNCTLKLPVTLSQGAYDLQFHYYSMAPRYSVKINCDGGQLNVVGHLAKYKGKFTIDDVTKTISYLINGTHDNLTIDDVTALIAVLLAGQ